MKGAAAMYETRRSAATISASLSCPRLGGKVERRTGCSSGTLPPGWIDLADQDRHRRACSIDGRAALHLSPPLKRARCRAGQAPDQAGGGVIELDLAIYAPRRHRFHNYS